MLFVNLGVLVGVYAGKHLWDKYHPKKIALADMDKAELAENTQHTKFAAVTVGLAVVSYWYSPLAVLNIGLISYNSVSVLQRTIDAWRKDKKITNSAYSAAVVILLLGAGKYFPIATNNLLYHLGSYFVSKSRTNAQQLTIDAYQQMPETVWIVDSDNVDKQISLEAVKQGDVIVVATGETIPIDGVVQSGTALVDQQALTGEADPVEKLAGEEVMAATLVLSGRIIIAATQDGVDTRINRLNALLQQTRDYKTSLQVKGEAWADKAAMPVILGSVVLMPVIGINPALALLFSVPTNTVRAMLSVQTSSHMQKTAKQGVFIKDGRVLEELSRIDVILFDKTGTLTQTEPEVVRVICCAGRDENALLALAAAAEQHMQHPIARAIHAQAIKRGLEIPHVVDSHYDLGLGVSVELDGCLIQIGSQRFIRQIISDEFVLPETLAARIQQDAGDTFIYIAIDGKVEGALQLRPCLRPEVPELVTALKERGFAQLGVISGDQQQVTTRMAEQLDLDFAQGDMLPQDKVAYIQELQAQGRHVCFIGDGLNDAIALKQANVSVSLNSATPIANEAAQIILFKDSLADFDQLFGAADQLHRNLNKNLNVWLGFGAANALAVPLLAFGPVQSSILYAVAYSAGLKFSGAIDNNSATSKVN